MRGLYILSREFRGTERSYMWLTREQPVMEEVMDGLQVLGIEGKTKGRKDKRRRKQAVEI